MTSQVRFQLGDGHEVDVPCGGIVGRGAVASLTISSLDVSEAHALVRLRGDTVRLLALRGALRVDGKQDTDVLLVPGLVIALSDTVTIEVVSITIEPGDAVPDSTEGGAGTALRILIGQGHTVIQAGQQPELVLGGNQADLIRLLADAEAPLHWTELARWFWSERDQPRWRERFDATIKEVRTKLRAHRVRPDLIWSWDGRYRLHLAAGDALTRE